MATVEFSQPQSMFFPYIWYGDVVSYDASHIALSNGYAYATYYGAFYYNSYGLAGGTVSGYQQFMGSTLDYTVSDANANALAVKAFLDAGNVQGLDEYVLQYNDTIRGSLDADGIRGYNGNDWLFGQGGDDVILGDAGNDYISGGIGNDFIDGGTGTDMAAFSARLRDYIITSNNDGSYRVSSTPDGLDVVSGVEQLQFSDQLINLLTFTGLNEGDSVFRFYNLATGTHFYTADTFEAENVMVTLPEYLFEGAAFDRNTTGGADTIDVFRFYNVATHAHFYTADPDEVAQVLATLPEYLFEGIAYEAHGTALAGTTELYRFYNTTTNTHFYTADAQEAENVKVELAGQYIYEGVAYYVDLA